MELGYRFLANDTLGMFVVMFAVLNVDGQKVVAAVVVVGIVGLLGIL